ILPFFLHSFPDVARDLLTFRYHGLEGARRKARTYGYDGAMFPWEVTDDGEEETPLYAALNIHTGNAAKVWSGVQEHHVTADIAYAVWDYYLLTADESFMMNHGYRILVETALFWVSRAVYREELGRYEILGVIGPDEYTEHVDNNAYTNHMAHFCVRTALAGLERLREKDPSGYQELTQELELEKGKAGMSDFVEKLYLPEPNEDGIIPQDDTFLTKTRLENISKYRESQLRQAILKDFSRDEVVEMQVLKQADVVMLLNLFPDLFPPYVVRKNVEFYEERTIHDSSLSYSAHAQAMAAIGDREAALSFFHKAMETDLSNNPLDSRDGIHSAALGGIWNSVVFGFAGFTHDEEGIRLSPQLPDHWNSITFRSWVRGCQLQIRVAKDAVSIDCVTACPEGVKVRIQDRTYRLEGNLHVELGKHEEKKKAIIFDLDGVVADTSVYHYLAWRELAKEMGFDFSREDNEQLKGVSRMASLELVLKAGRIQGLKDEEKQELAEKKNQTYLRMIESIDEKSILPGIMDFLKLVREKGYRTALGSASRSGRLVVERLGIGGYFDVIVDGNMVSAPKPDPEVFTKAADLLHVAYQNCIVVEDAAAGVEAARAAGMRCIGIGEFSVLKDADCVVNETKELVGIDLAEIFWNTGEYGV
ncbi:MAG TPA: beta-phosphoglucomutase, partial [Clostridiaceae bacterium]|nr:beta-phosphoglucomutase [Clostridiaceae bacterium]